MLAVNTFVITHTFTIITFELIVNTFVIISFTNELTRSQTRYMEFDGRDFWLRFDDLLLKKRSNIRELCHETGLLYGTINTQRTRHTIPKAEYLYFISRFLGVSIEYLLTGEPRESNPEIRAIQENQGIKKIVDFLIKNPEVIEKIIMLFDIDVAKSATDRLA